MTITESKMVKTVDIIIFGATGFTGKHCIPAITQILSKMAKGTTGDNGALTWAIAGRSEQKLRAVLDEYTKKLNIPLGHIPVIIADISDESSLYRMASMARVVVNCCGPYRFYGEPVVKACVEAGTHHVDVSGEPQYMERMQLEYHEKARKNGVYVVSACGFDSIPCDLGVIYLTQQFPNVVFNSVATYIEWWTEEDAGSGPGINTGTWESAIYGLAHANELRGLRSRLFPTKLPQLLPKLPLIVRPHKNDLIDGWILPFLGSDKSVVKRTQRYMYENENKRPIQVETYFTVKSLTAVVLLIVFGSIFKMMVQFGFGRKLLLKYPALFSGGFFSNENPSEARIEKSHFRTIFEAKGWETTQTPTERELDAELAIGNSRRQDKSVIAEVTGRNPGYGATCIALVLAGVTILTDSENLPPGGGVYSPGAAFAKTSLIKELNKNGVTFKIVSTSKL